MSRVKRRLLLIFSGNIVQPELDRLRVELDLTRMGRLTDREDEHFGTRQLYERSDRSAMLNLWRMDRESWSVTIDATPEYVITDAELNAWERRISDAAIHAGLSFVERRLFQRRENLESRTEWRNENWLRTAGWDLPAETLDELWSVLNLGPTATSRDRRTELAKFMESPPWEAAPRQVKLEAKNFMQEDHGE